MGVMSVTKYTANYTRQNSLRWSSYNYTWAGQNFITICTRNRRKLLCNAGVGFHENPIDFLTDIGHSVFETIQFINMRNDGIVIEPSIIMPNHIHMIISIKRCQNEKIHVGNSVRAIKTYSNKAYNSMRNTRKGKLWQRGIMIMLSGMIRLY